VRVQVLFFGVLRDITGQTECLEEVEDGLTAAALFDHVAARFPGLAPIRKSVMVARNQEFAEPSEVLCDGDEIALLPPVSGGSSPWIHSIRTPGSGNFYALTRHPIDAAAMAREILQGHDGAFVDFEGVVRNNTKGRPTRFLEYECYESMAIKMMAQIGEEIAGVHAISRIALIHRLGRMEIGETSVAVIACAPHRRPAFEAALDGINRLKKMVPIWKKEYFEDGEVWVEGEWDDSLKTL
jgi:molybdopterin synthase catalytic subunit